MLLRDILPIRSLLTSPHSSLILIRTLPIEMDIRDGDTDEIGRHFKRVIGYARSSDYAVGAATATAGPGLMLLWEKIAPSYVGKGGFAPIMRLTGVIGLGAGFLMFYQRSIRSFPIMPAPRQALANLLSPRSAILRLHGKQARSGNGYEGDGSESKEQGASVRPEQHNPVCPGHGQSELQIHGCVAACYAVVQLRQSQSARC